MGPPSGEDLRVRPVADVRWVVEAQGVRLFRSESATTFLGYPEAAIWDFVSRGYPSSRIVELLSAIVAPDEEAAARLLVDCVSGLVGSGYLERSGDE